MILIMGNLEYGLMSLAAGHEKKNIQVSVVQRCSGTSINYILVV